MTGKKLSPKQEVFCIAYMVTANATTAYRTAYNTAGSKDAVVWVNACRLRQNPRVAARIGELRDQAADLAAVSQARVLREVAAIALSNLADLFGPDGCLLSIQMMAPEARAAIAFIESTDAVHRVTTKIKLWDKNAALEKLMRHLGMFDVDHKQAADIFEGVPRETVKLI